MDNPYRARGTLSGLSYIERSADSELRDVIKDNDRYPFFLAPRQSGKSSVMERARSLLTTEELSVVIIDLSLFSQKYLANYDRFVLNFVVLIYKKLGVAEILGSRLRDLKHSPIFLLESIRLLLNNIAGRIVVCIDELDALLHSKFKDDFLSQIRALFNERASDPLFVRIQFIVAAAVSKDSLIMDPNRSPFNVGAQIILHDFDKKQLDKLVTIGNWLNVEDIERASDRIIYWTNGSVFLSQSILEKAYRLRCGKEVPRDICELIDDIVTEIIISAPQNIHFTNIARQLRKNPRSLSAWGKWVDGIVPDMEVKDSLLLAGISDQINPIRNKIYQKIFSIRGTLCLMPESSSSVKSQTETNCATKELLKDRDFSTLEIVINKQIEDFKNYGVFFLPNKKTRFFSIIEKTKNMDFVGKLEGIEKINDYILENAMFPGAEYIHITDEVIANIDVVTLKDSVSLVPLSPKLLFQPPIEIKDVKLKLKSLVDDIEIISGDDLQKILEEIESLSSLQDIPRKIVILQHVLSLVLKEFNPILWASLQVEMGNTLHSNPKGNREDDIEKAIEHYNKALEVITRENYPVDWAKIQRNLANAYSNFIDRDWAEDIEKAIEHYNKALEVYTYHEFLLYWAEIQNNLANTYLSRVRGDRADNIEKAIEYYEDAARIYTYHEFPEQWAMTQNNLANAYLSRIRGDQPENIEQAIEHYEKALKARTPHKFPVQWAEIQNNLANAYLSRIRGEGADNIEEVIKHYNQALKVRTLQDFPKEWAKIQHNLGKAYRCRIREDKAENIEKAIEYYEQALKVYTYHEYPEEWAMTQNNLGATYLSRIKGSRAENVKKAIVYYKEAFRVYTYSDFPEEWATIEYNLANAYFNSIWGNKAENIEKAIEHYEQALKVRTSHNLSLEWATVLNNMGAAYCNRIKGDQADNIEKAIEYYNQALSVFTPFNYPVKWAAIQYNMALAYSRNIRGDYSKNIERAIIHYSLALEVYTPKDFPVRCAEILNKLEAYRNHISENMADNIRKAIENYKNAMYTPHNFPV